MLNELEWVRGELWANIYQTNLVAPIDPTTGAVIGWAEVGALLTAVERREVAERGCMAHGIAFDPARRPHRSTRQGFSDFVPDFLFASVA